MSEKRSGSTGEQVSLTKGDAPTAPRRTLMSRIPDHLFGGRARTSTVVLVIVFLGLLLLYGQRADYYSRLDEEAAAASATRTAAPRTTEETPEYTEPVTTRSTPRSSTSSAPSTTSSTGADESTSPTDGSQPTTTTTAPGFQLPTIPGLVLPGQTPTTTPVR